LGEDCEVKSGQIATIRQKAKIGVFYSKMGKFDFFIVKWENLTFS
jgi:hypothetical protein